MMIRYFSFFAVLCLLSTSGFSQNVQNNNRGVIINVIVPEPVTNPYFENVPAPAPEPNEFDRNMEQGLREIRYKNALRNPYIDEEKWKKERRKVTTARINLRTEACTTCPVVKVLPAGTPVEIFEGTSSDPVWVRVAVEIRDRFGSMGLHDLGYVQRKYLKPLQNHSLAVPQAARAAAQNDQEDRVRLLREQERLQLETKKREAERAWYTTEDVDLVSTISGPTVLQRVAKGDKVTKLKEINGWSEVIVEGKNGYFGYAGYIKTSFLRR